MSSPFLDTPFGSWPKDLEWQYLMTRPDLEPRPLALSRCGRVDRFRALGVVTKLYSSPVGGPPITSDRLRRAWKLMHLAGDCSVSVVGRLFMQRVAEGITSYTVIGLCMPMETPIDPPNIGAKDARIRIIHQLRDLVGALHSKGIVHGDLKPQNLLICSDGRLRLCDFDEGAVEGDGFRSDRMSYPYCSTFRARNDTVPPTRAEDMHGMALTMWEIYTGTVPLSANDETTEEAYDGMVDRCLAGFLPDMALIDDPEIASLITSCLAAGPDRPDSCTPNSTYCVKTRFVSGRSGPGRTYTRIVHSYNCPKRTDSGDGCCDPRYQFEDHKVFTSPVEPLCTGYNRGVECFGLPS